MVPHVLALVFNRRKRFPAGDELLEMLTVSTEHVLAGAVQREF